MEEKKKRREKGEGSIIQLGSGEWRARITVGGKQKSFYGKTEKEAARVLTDYKKKLGLGQQIKKRKKYDEVLTEFLKKKKQGLKDKSYMRLEGIVEKHIRGELGFYLVDKLDEVTIQELIDKKKKTQSYSSLKKIYEAINSSLRMAKEDGTIAINPCVLVQMPPKSKFEIKKPVEHTFSSEEIKRFEAAATSKCANGSLRYENGGLFVFLLNTGLRLGEACALKWADYNETTGVIRVHSSVVQVKNDEGKYITKEQKTVKSRASERFLKLNQKALSALPEARKGKYIFCAENGKALQPSNVRRTLQAILERANVDYRSPHTFRHTYATLAIEKGYDLRLLSEQLGHQDISTTHKSYIASINEQKAAAMEPIDIY